MMNQGFENGRRSEIRKTVLRRTALGPKPPPSLMGSQLQAVATPTIDDSVPELAEATSLILVANDTASNLPPGSGRPITKTGQGDRSLDYSDQ